MKKALITGITGQDGAYLAEFLLGKGYQVHGIKRKTSLFNTSRVDHLYQDPHEENLKFILHYGELTDSSNLVRIIRDVKPDEIYNLGAMSHVQVSFQSPEYTSNVDGIGVLRILEAIRVAGLEKETKFYQASTSELYGKVQEIPQSETTPFYPRSPYAVAKLFGYWITVNYREAYNMFACNGILFNHESPIRGETFVTRKITRAVAKIALGLQAKLYLGNLDAKRDWGHAKDYVEAMWLILQQDKPEDFVIATGVTTSVRDFVSKSFEYIGIKIGFKGQGIDEIGVIEDIDESKLPDWRALSLKQGQEVVCVDPRYFRPTEVELLVGNPSKAKSVLGWEPKYDLDSLIAEMIDCDLELFSRDQVLKNAGFSIKNEYE